MAMRALLAVALVTGLALVPLSPAATALTPDQQLVAGLETASAASRAALRDLGQPTAKRVASASGNLRRAVAALATASKAAPRAIGALELASVRTVLARARTDHKQALASVAAKHYGAARLKVRAALGLTTAALEEFGVPLEKEFQAFAVNRDFRNIPAFVDYSGLSATLGADIAEVIIGAADRTTANAGEPGIDLEALSAGLPITQMSGYINSDPIGRFTSGWCKLDSGLISCRIRPAMPEANVFTIAFGPKLPKGTKVLVKFRSTSGKRSYAVFTTR